MNVKACAKELIRISKMVKSLDDHAAWSEILDLIKTKKHHGDEEFVNFCSEVWNGGTQQWIENGHAENFEAVLGVAKLLGSKGQQLATILQHNKRSVKEYGEFMDDRNRREENAGDEDERIDNLNTKLDEIDDWFYANDDAIIAEFLAYLKQ